MTVINPSPNNQVKRFYFPKKKLPIKLLKHKKQQPDRPRKIKHETKRRVE